MNGVWIQDAAMFRALEMDGGPSYDDVVRCSHSHAAIRHEERKSIARRQQRRVARHTSGLRGPRRRFRRRRR